MDEYTGPKTLLETLELTPIRPHCDMCQTYYKVGKAGKYTLCDTCLLDLDEYEDFEFELTYLERELAKA